jgi:hypothetical protein
MHLIVSSAKSRVHVTSERPMEEPVSGLLRLSIAVGALFFCALNDVHVDGFGFSVGAANPWQAAAIGAYPPLSALVPRSAAHNHL